MISILSLYYLKKWWNHFWVMIPMVNITNIYSLINYNHLKYSLENMNHTSITFQIIYFMIFFTKFISESHVDILLKVFFPIASTYGVLTIHTWIHIQVFSKFQSKCKGQNYRILNLSPSSNTIFPQKDILLTYTIILQSTTS